MATPAAATDAQELFRRSWAGVGIGEATVVVAGFLALWGVFSEIDCIGLGCSDDSEVGAGAVVLFITAGALLVPGLSWTAFVSGHPRGTSIARGALAAAAIGVSGWLGVGVGGAEGFPPGVVLGVGIAGAIVVREPTSVSRYVRLGSIVALSLVSGVGDSLASVLFVLVVFPAIGIADTITLPPRANPER